MSLTTTQFILLILAIAAMLWGLYAIYRAWHDKQQSPLLPQMPADGATVPPTTDAANPHETGIVLENGTANKNGIPIIPRQQRKFTDNFAQADALQPPTLEKTTLEPTTSEQKTSSEKSESFIANSLSDKVALDPHPTELNLSTPAGMTTTIMADGDIYIHPNAPTLATPVSGMPAASTISQPNIASGSQPDAFSALANATETITPVVHTFDESQLKQEAFQHNSPILDSHIQSQIDQEQNSPLNNAEQNINISLFPSQQFGRFNGKDLLAVVDKYGLKYGAMNMFHRYENKDGTGILWFSMMMVNEEGIMPFDLNKLPMQNLNGLVLFLSLPHPQAGQSFESMISIAKMMANDLYANIFDEMGEPLSTDSITLLKSIAVHYGKQPE